MTTPLPNDVPPVSIPQASQPQVTAGSSAPEAVIALIGATIQYFFRSQVGVRKEEVAWTLSHLAQVVRQSERGLTQNQQSLLGAYAGSLAGQLESASTYLHGHDLDHIRKDVENVSQSNPALFLGAMLALGFIAARFMKNTQPPSST